jgi:hypothetical protein
VCHKRGSLQNQSESSFGQASTPCLIEFTTSGRKASVSLLSQALFSPRPLLLCLQLSTQGGGGTSVSARFRWHSACKIQPPQFKKALDLQPSRASLRPTLNFSEGKVQNGKLSGRGSPAAAAKGESRRSLGETGLGWAVCLRTSRLFLLCVQIFSARTSETFATSHPPANPQFRSQRRQRAPSCFEELPFDPDPPGGNHTPQKHEACD